MKIEIELPRTQQQQQQRTTNDCNRNQRQLQALDNTAYACCVIIAANLSACPAALPSSAHFAK